MQRSARIAAGSLAIALVMPPPLFSQGILNTERLQPMDPEGLHVSFDAGVSGAAGNTRLLNAAGAGIAGYRGERHWTRVMAGGRFLADRERRVLNDHFAQLRHSYTFSPEIESFTFLQYQMNRSLLLRDRWLVGGGLRHGLSVGPVQLHLGLGLMYEREQRDAGRIGPEDAPILRTVRFANHLVARMDLAGGASLVNVLYHQPAAAAFGEFRVLNDLSLSVPVAEPVRLNVTVEWRHDSHPPGDLRRDDVNFRTGFRVDLR